MSRFLTIAEAGGLIAAKKLSPVSPENERAYIDALAKLFSGDANADLVKLAHDYIPAARELWRKYPDDPACAYHTGMAWYQKGDRARAKMLLSHAMELRPPKDIESGVTDLLNRVN